MALIVSLLCGAPSAGQPSVARQWDEAILDAIRIDTPRPPVHARNLYHMSAAMYDAWAAYDATARGQFVQEKHVVVDLAAARDESIAYAAYRVLSARYQLSHDPLASQQIFDELLASQGYDKHVTTTAGDSPAAVGNRIARQILARTLDDGSNEAHGYADTTGYTAVNTPMLTGFATATDQVATPLTDPSRWQPLYVESFTNQNGTVAGSNLQQYIAPHWGPVTPFAMQSSSGPYAWSDVDPGPQPQLGGGGDAEYRAQAMDVLRRSNALDPTQGPGAELVNLSPAVNGNRRLGTYESQGYVANPVTGQPYADNFVKLADYGRVLAEFWADGPHSETPPGHWNVIANQVSDDVRLTRKIGGAGAEVDRLEWDVKLYLTLNGAVHDAAIAAWGLKRKYDSARPITMIRYMGHVGQSSDPGLPSYDPLGLPLEEGLVELITFDSVLPGGRHRHAYVNVNRDHNGDFFPFFTEVDLVGKLVVHAWAQHPDDPATEFGGTDWILAENWLPYQMENFVSPAFPGYISGHSTFSRAAAETLALYTGSEFFPGGLGELTFTPDYLRFEDGPSEPVTLQWATYFDAADEAGVSRLWGGIHPAMDDLPGRVIGDWIGRQAFATAQQRFLNVPEPAALLQAAWVAWLATAWRLAMRRRSSVDPEAPTAFPAGRLRAAGRILSQRRVGRLASMLALICGVGWAAPWAPATTQAAEVEFPRVRVDKVRRAFHNGEHNAFTDLIRFGGKFYLTFRSCPDGHMVHPTSSIIVLCSEDARQWKQVHRFRIPQRDPRDPHFLAFRGRLFVYTGTWYSGETTLPLADYDLNLHLGYACVTDDGAVWSEPILLEGTFGHYIWRASSFDGKAYLCGRRKTAFAVADRGEGDAVESAMLESDDGLVWRTRALFQTERGDETAFLFEADGSVLGIGRRERGTAQLLRSEPPYAVWRRTDLDRYVGGPLLTRWGNRYVVGGRNLQDPQRPVTALYWLDGDALRACAELPSGGDTSYPGFVELDADRALVSWYSSHETDEQGRPRTAIYLADLAIDR